MSQYGNYPKPNYKDWNHQFQINKLNKEIETNKNSILIVFIYAIILTVFNLYYSHKQDNRLNEHKRLLITQQEQINQLIINAEYNNLRYEQK